MPLVLTQDQRHFQESAQRFFSRNSPVASFRKLRDAEDLISYSPEVWTQIVDLGFPAASISESCGGLGLGFITLGSILEEAGRTLCASPLLATAALGASAVELAGSEVQRKSVLGAVCVGQLTLSLALDESHRHALQNIQTVASRISDGYLLNGEKCFVIDGSTADKLIVVARMRDTQSAEPALFLVDRETEGLLVSPLKMADSRGTANIGLRNVKVHDTDRLQSGGDGLSVLSSVLDRARACLAAEMLGGIAELFERTIGYLREREQFGVKIGSFQALKHRAARLYTEIELTRSSVMAALSALDNRTPDASLLCSLAKARANDTYRLVSNEAVQMHGGMGVTDELDVGLFLKRSRVLIQAFGDSSYLRNQYAELSGY